ncbi:MULTISPECIES: AraC family transcriptional regulator [unclassified Mameliella]|uniref:AraC-like transcriptional regulator QhpR n=1 Tax=unclassified Mameliella TaxID=2630630 RepID=UPI00273DC29A|nr:MULTISPECIES: AraC family transcriptional regulator [unclassified Mameliella]
METSVISSTIARSVFDGLTPAVGADVPLSFFVTGLERQRAQPGAGQSAWSLGEQLPLEALGVLGDAILRAPTLGSALRCFVHGIPLVQSNTALSMEVAEDRVRVGYRILDPDIWPRRADAELTLAMIHGVCMRFGMDRHTLLDVGFEHGADDGTQSISRYNRTDTLCDESENYLVFPVRCLSLTRPDALGDGGAPDQQLSSHLRHLPVSRRVRQQILQRIGQGSIGQAEIACELGMSERSLRRTLAAEETCYHDIRDECRRSMALALLKRSELSLSDVAFSLGYSDQTAFSRAFSRWFGEPPSRHSVAG